jgi:diguanylate cyclase (GGDEF)-like protein/PAS domain S-box-containing protein
MSAIAVTDGHLRAAIEGSHDAWLFLHAVRDRGGRTVDFTIVDLNGGAESLAGRPRSDVVGRSLGQILPGHRVNGLLARYATVADTGSQFDGEHHIPVGGPGGVERWLDIHAVPIPGGVAVCARDITPRKRAEAGRARFAAILEATPDVVAIMGVDGRLLSVNRAGRALMGLPASTDLRDPNNVIDAGLTLADIQPQLAPGGALEHAIAEAERTGVWRGETTLRKRDGREIAVEEVLLAHRDAAGVPEFYSALMRDLTDRKQTEDALRALALVDDLTGLYNRRGFLTVAEQALERARKRLAPAVVFYFDVDRFKAVNDEHGHAEGDTALETLADALRRTFRESDVVGRIGGDEFVALAAHGAGQRSSEIARTVVERLRGHLAEINASGEHPWTLDVSVGVAWDGGDPDATLDGLLAEADAKLCEVKSRHRSA